MAHTGRRLKVTYWMKVRTRETHDLPIAGGQKRGPHRRRVTRWSKWKTHQAADGPIGALQLLETFRARFPGADVGVFHGGTRLEAAQLEYRIEQARKAREDGES